MASTPSPMGGLSSTLHTQMTDWIERRKPQEEEMLRAYRDMMRIATDDDTKDIGTSKAQKSKIFIGSTRSKIRSARAKIKDALFGAGQMPFDTEPSQEDLKQFADTVEEIISYQLKEGDFKKVLSTGVDSICTYGTGFIFGPFVRSKKHTSVQQIDGGGFPQLQEVSTDYYCPYYEHGRTMDTYPDPEAEDADEGLGVYWCSRKQPQFIKDLKGQEGYSDQAIDRACQAVITAYSDEGSDRTNQARQNLYRYTKEGRVWFSRYFGLVKKRELEEWKRSEGSEVLGSPKDSIYDDMVEAVVILAGGEVIKAEENPYKDQKRPVLRCVYEDVEHEMWGVGIAKNNDPNQRVVNSAFRLYIEGKAFALLKTCSIDRSKFEIGEDFKLFPGKKFLMRPGLTPEERKEAIIWHDMNDVTDGWEKVIELAEQFSDDDTGITKYSQGTDSQHLNDTATGISMIMNASSLPIKEVLSNIDEMWIDRMIESLIEWDLDNLEPETVKVLLGQQQAKIWGQIKQYGKTNFMKWFATGSQTFMMKEVLMHKLQGYLNIVGANERFSQYVDERELLEQVWDAGQIGKESPVYDEETVKQNAQNNPMQHAQQAIQEVEQKASELIKQAQEQTQEAQKQAQEAKRQEQFKIAELQSKEREADRSNQKDMFETLARISESTANLHKLEADIDLTQAQTAKTLAEAGLNPDGTLLKQATEAETDTGGNEEAKQLIGSLQQVLTTISSPKKRTAQIRGPSGQVYTLDSQEQTNGG